MYSDPVPNIDVNWKTGAPHLTKDPGANPAEEPQTQKNPSLSAAMFHSFLGTCGGFMETAALFLGPNNCMSCMSEPLRSPRSMRRNSSSKAKLKHANKLKENPSREGEVVDVPIKLVKSRSGKALENEDGQVYDPYRSFDDSISAISAHTLDEMARKYPKPVMASLRENTSGTSSRPRDGEELRPPSPARISDDSSDDSGQRDESSPRNEIENDIPFRRLFDEPLKISKVEQNRPTYELIENDIPFTRKKKPSRKAKNGKNTALSASKKPNGALDVHTAPTPKARGRKSKRRSSKQTPEEFEPQFAEI